MRTKCTQSTHRARHNEVGLRVEVAAEYIITMALQRFETLALQTKNVYFDNRKSSFSASNRSHNHEKDNAVKYEANLQSLSGNIRMGFFLNIRHK